MEKYSSFSTFDIELQKWSSEKTSVGWGTIKASAGIIGRTLKQFAQKLLDLDPSELKEKLIENVSKIPRVKQEAKQKAKDIPAANLRNVALKLKNMAIGDPKKLLTLIAAGIGVTTILSPLQIIGIIAGIATGKGLWNIFSSIVIGLRYGTEELEKEEIKDEAEEGLGLEEEPEEGESVEEVEAKLRTLVPKGYQIKPSKKEYVWVLRRPGMAYKLSVKWDLKDNSWTLLRKFEEERPEKFKELNDQEIENLLTTLLGKREVKAV